eukprot:4876104-Lingulodinium_polyedra.AAC.1
MASASPATPSSAPRTLPGKLAVGSASIALAASRGRAKTRPGATGNRYLPGSNAVQDSNMPRTQRSPARRM